MDRSRIPVNFRAFLVVSLFVAAAVGCAFIARTDRAAGIVLGCIVIVAAAALGGTFLFLSLRKGVKLRYAIAFLLSFALSLCAFTVATVTADRWENTLVAPGEHAVGGRICAVVFSSEEYCVILEDVSLDGETVAGKARIKLRSGEGPGIAEFIEVGDRLSFIAKVNSVELYEYGSINGYAYRSDIRYTAQADMDVVRVKFGSKTFRERFLGGIERLLHENMGSELGSVAFAMMTGDKYGMDSDTVNNFYNSGLGHILAISGLHIGFLIAFLSFLLAKLGNKIRFPMIIAFLTAYAALVDFLPSVTRALIMATVSGFAVFVGGRRDLLSALCCSFSLILAVKPWYLFEAGFLCSFCSIFGIALFGNTFRRLLNRIKIPDMLSNAVGASASVSLGLLPVSIACFNEIKWYSPFINLLMIPYVSIMFTLTFCLLPIAAIPGLARILIVSKFAMMPFKYAVLGSAYLYPQAITLKSTAHVFFCYPIMFCASEFFMIRRGKIPIVIYSAVMCLVIILACAL